MGGLAVGLAKGVIQRRYTGWGQWLSLLVGAVLVSVLVGLAVHETGLSETQQWAVIGVCTFVAEDLLLAVGAIGAAFARDPLHALQHFWDAIRGMKK